MARRNRSAETPSEDRPQVGRPGFIARLRNYFIAGILIIAPIAITFWIAWNLIQFIDNSITPIIPPRWNPETYLPFGIPGLGLVLLFIILTLVGVLTAGLLGRVFTRTSDRILARVPVVRSVYSATKQIFETVLAQKSTAFREVCMIEYPCRGIWAIGFVTGQTVGEVQRMTEDTVINVFVPATPNPTTGFLLFVPKRDVGILDMTVEEGIKLVISGGIVSPSEKHTTLMSDVRPKEEPPKPAPKTGRASLPHKIRNYFLTGVLVAAPLSITFWLVWKFVTYVDNQVTPYIPPRWNPETYLPFDLPGLGLVVALVGLTLVGMFAAGFFGGMIMSAGERLLSRLPVIRSIYGALKQIFETVLAQQSAAFRQVVLVQYPRKGVWAIAFVTGRSEGQIQTLTEDDVTNVFLPTTPNPTSGFLLFVPNEDLSELTMTVEEGLKMVVSGGIVTPPDPDSPEPEVESEGASQSEPAHAKPNPAVREEAKVPGE